MDKIGVIYFSGTGNTKFVSEVMKMKLEKYGKEVDLINIEKDKINSKDYDSIIIGGPVYVDRFPEILIKYIEENLRGFKGKCMLFSTQAAESEAIVFPHCAHRVPFLHIVYDMFIPMPNNFSNFMFKRSSKEEENKLILQSIDLVEVGIKEFLESEIKIYPKKNIKENMMDLVYKMVYPYYASYITKKISLDEEKCINCKICEKNCPVQCIKITDKVTFNKECVLCQRCMSNCPKGAFIYKNKSFVQYNPDFNVLDKEI